MVRGHKLCLFDKLKGRRECSGGRGFRAWAVVGFLGQRGTKNREIESLFLSNSQDPLLLFCLAVYQCFFFWYCRYVARRCLLCI